MEAGEIMKMVEDVFRNRYFIIDVFVSNDDSTIRAVLNNPSIVTQGQVPNSSKVKLDEEILVPYFLADNSHRGNVVDKRICYTVNYGKAHRCGCTKADAIILNKYWRYMIKKNRKKSRIIETGK